MTPPPRSPVRAPSSWSAWPQDADLAETLRERLWTQGRMVVPR